MAAKPEQKLNSGTVVLLSIASFVIIAAGMKASASLLVPFLLSIFIAIVSSPPLLFLKTHKVPTGLAILIVTLVVVGFGFIFVALIGASLDDFSEALPVYQSKIQTEVVRILDWVESKGLELPQQVLTEYFDPGSVMSLVSSTLTGFGGVLTNAFLILLTVIFILLEVSSFPGKLAAIFNNPETSLNRLTMVVDNVNRYMAIKTTVSIVTGLMIAAWLWVLGVDFPLLWGALAFLLNFVPNIGSFIAAVPAVLLAFIQLGFGSALLTGVGFVFVNVFMGNFIEPRFMGRGLGLSTLIVFLSLVFWGWVLGPVGMLLSVPLTMTLKIALDSNDDTRWIAILLGADIDNTEPIEPSDEQDESSQQAM